jgi:hypothetical protein
MRHLVLALAVLSLSSSVSFAKGNSAPAPVSGSFEEVAAKLPICRDKNWQPFRYNNEEVLNWKHNTQNQFTDRGLVIGRFVRFLTRNRSHDKMVVDISANGSTNEADFLEVTYNTSFGEIADPKAGDIVAACGDYITSNAPTRRYPASELGALIHWIHASNSSRHAPGFLWIAGTLYGFKGDGAGQVPEYDHR